MAIDFDGDNLLITLDSGVTEVDVVNDLYRAWKDWMLLTPLNRRYPQAFISDGGNPLTSIINQGSYIFLNNTAGWRIKPPEENITIFLTGNLAALDIGIETIIPTVGNFTAAILGLQPITQGVTQVFAGQLEYASFNGAVTIDAINGTPGTGKVANGNPIGTPADPSNNVTDALAIAVERGFTKLRFNGDYTLDVTDVIDGYILEGEARDRTLLTLTEGATVLNCTVQFATVTGDLDGGTTLVNCTIRTLNYVDGSVRDCEFEETITLNGSKAELIRCWSGVAGTATPTIDMNGTGTDLLMRDYSGGIAFANYTSGTNAVSIDMSSGQVRFESSITSGRFTVRGIAKLTDNSNGAIIDSTNLLNKAILDDITTEVQELRQENPTTQEITKEVWSADLLDIDDEETAGYVLQETAELVEQNLKTPDQLASTILNTDMSTTEFEPNSVGGMLKKLRLIYKILIS